MVPQSPTTNYCTKHLLEKLITHIDENFSPTKSSAKLHQRNSTFPPPITTTGVTTSPLTSSPKGTKSNQNTPKNSHSLSGGVVHQLDTSSLLMRRAVAGSPCSSPPTTALSSPLSSELQNGRRLGGGDYGSPAKLEKLRLRSTGLLSSSVRRTISSSPASLSLAENVVGSPSLVGGAAAGGPLLDLATPANVAGEGNVGEINAGGRGEENDVALRLSKLHRAVKTAANFVHTVSDKVRERRARASDEARASSLGVGGAAERDDRPASTSSEDESQISRSSSVTGFDLDDRFIGDLWHSEHNESSSKDTKNVGDNSALGLKTNKCERKTHDAVAKEGEVAVLTAKEEEEEEEEERYRAMKAMLVAQGILDPNEVEEDDLPDEVDVLPSCEQSQSGYGLRIISHP